MLTTAPRGTKDIMPSDVNAWRYLEETMRKICAQYGYKEIRTPVFEHTELFQRGIGDTTDVVEKEMYTFTDAVTAALLCVRKTPPVLSALTLSIS